MASMASKVSAMHGFPPVCRALCCMHSSQSVCKVRSAELYALAINQSAMSEALCCMHG